MSPASSAQRLEHMRQAIAAVRRLTQNTSFETYSADPDLAAAVERYLERLSEASRHVPDDWKREFPHVGWRGLADLGNVLRHVYDQGIDEEIWTAVQVDLQPLSEAVHTLLRRHGHLPRNPS